jgi:hypothetical protein
MKLERISTALQDIKEAAIMATNAFQNGMKYRPTVVFDFDGVIHSYRSKWQGPEVIPDEPVEGMKEAIDEIRKEFEVVVVSTRCTYPEGMPAIISYLSKHSIVVDRVMAEKPPAIAYIDDRAITFDGDPKSLLFKIRTFVPWNKGMPANILKEGLMLIANGEARCHEEEVAQDVLDMYNSNRVTGIRPKNRKEKFLSKTPTRVIVVAILMDNGAIETIVNYENLDLKMQYYEKAYDENLCLKANPAIKILDWMVL